MRSSHWRRMGQAPVAMRHFGRLVTLVSPTLCWHGRFEGVLASALPETEIAIYRLLTEPGGSVVYAAGLANTGPETELLGRLGATGPRAVRKPR